MKPAVAPIVIGRAAALAAWITPLALAAIGWRYLSLIVDAATFPENEPWLIIWTISAAALLGSIALAPKRAAVAWALVIAGAAALIIALSGMLPAALIAVWVLSVGTLLGDRLLNGLGVISDEEFLERVLIALILGLVVFSMATFALAVAGLLRPAYVWGMLIACSLIESRHAVALIRRVGASVRTTPFPDRDGCALLLLTALAMLASLVWAVAPETAYDSLNYHLAVPRFYLEAGGLIDLPYFFHSYFAHLPDHFYALCMALHGEMVAKLANFVIAIASSAGVYCLGRLVFTPRVGLWAIALYVTTPLIGALAGTTYTDLTVALFLTMALVALLRWRRSNLQGWMGVCGVLAGGAVGVKLNAMYGVIGLGLTIVILLFRAAGPVKQRLRALLTFGALVAAIAIPWYLPAYVYTGNPTFPLLNGIFKSPRTNPINHLMDSSAFGVGTKPNALIEMPARLTFNPRFGSSPGAVGIAALLCAPFGLFLLLRRRNTEGRILGFVGAVYMAFWAATFQYTRYYIAILPMVVALGAAGVTQLLHTRMTERVTRVFLLMFVMAQAAMLTTMFHDLPERFPVGVALGLESRETFLNRALPGYGAAQHINNAISPRQRVLSVDTERVRFYLNPPIDSLPESLSDHPLITLSGSDEEMAAGLARIGYAYLLVTHSAMKDPKPWFPYIRKDFLSRFATLEFDDGVVAAYRLRTDSGTDPNNPAPASLPEKQRGATSETLQR